MSSAGYEDSEADANPEAKRRRLRKGTHSCWECKRRKVRCKFASPTDAVCITCRRRGTKCISQELPDEQHEENADRLERLEALLSQLVGRIDHHGASEASRTGRQGIAALTPSSGSEANPFMSLAEPLSGSNPRGANEASSSTPDSWAPSVPRVAPRIANKLEQISQALLAAFPIQKDVDILLERCKGTSQFCHKVNDMLHQQNGRGQLEIHAELAETVGPLTHPVLLAKHMLMFASLLAQTPPQKHIGGLSEHHRVAMERLADTAISLVTTNEELLGTMEGLECVLLEGLYHLNCGNLRRAWLAHRRATAAAQLIGICRPRCPPVKTITPDTDVDPQFMWSHIVYMDRFLSLILGLPSGQPDVRLDPELPPTTSSDRLERCHARISARILERNQLGVSQHGRELTLDIDRELRTTAESLPADFWRPPDLAGLDRDSDEAFRETMRIRDQVTHYTLLNQLHLPFLMCPNRCEIEYSRSSCVYASREVLSRFVAFRAVTNSWSCCRLADFVALVAGMTLIISHLVSHQYEGEDNHLAHQRLGDRATVEQALRHMEQNSQVNEDVLSAKCACLLKNLLRIEAAAAQRSKTQSDDVVHDPHDALFITVPYFGAVRIAHDGIKSTDAVQPSPQNADADITIGGIGSVHFGDSVVARDSCPSSADAPRSAESRPHLDEVHATTDRADLPSAVFTDDFVMQQDLYPEAAAGIDDWVFQGIDTAFFDSLTMMGPDVQVGDGAVTNWDRSAPGG